MNRWMCEVDVDFVLDPSQQALGNARVSFSNFFFFILFCDFNYFSMNLIYHIILKISYVLIQIVNFILRF